MNLIVEPLYWFDNKYIPSFFLYVSIRLFTQRFIGLILAVYSHDGVFPCRIGGGEIYFGIFELNFFGIAQKECRRRITGFAELTVPGIVRSRRQDIFAFSIIKSDIIETYISDITASAAGNY